MKYLFLSTILSIIMILSACNSSSNSSSEKTYEYVEETYELNDMLKQKIGDWAEEGVVCYGLVVLKNEDGTSDYGVPVKAKIIKIKTDSIKMKSLEKINLGDNSSCSQMGISYGQKWWESEGDIFKTKEEAEAFLKKNKLNVK